VLVVDDDTSVRFLCRVNLELEGWTVREAASIAQAREEVAEQRVDVVVLDMHVGRESGLGFLAELRDEHPGVAVVLLTGSVGAAVLDSAGADAVLPKPFEPEKLTETVRTLASRVAERAG
jgi:DNA-binding response OmpR family regulator